MKRYLIACIVALVSFYPVLSQAQNSMVVHATRPKGTIETTMWGIFFEDINLGADGGIYAELIKNRSFEFFKPLMGWTVQPKQFAEGSILILNRQEENASNPRYMRVTKDNVAAVDLSISNEGFRGMGIKKGLRYNFSLMYRQQKAGLTLHIELLNSRGSVIGDTVLLPEQTDTAWHQQSAGFYATETEPKASMRIRFEGKGSIDMDMISLFPGDTWKNRPGGLRADMVQLLADMKPGFIRFPGGCIVEGYDLSQRNQWKKTVGPVENRELIINRWNFEFAHKPTPDYFQTFGLGFFEYFQLAEDIGAAPLPIINCGMACQFNSAELVPLEELGPYVQDALDLIEFANGDATTKWGKMRSEMGHPAPFNLRMMGIGNENWGPQYLERLALFQKAIKSKYPDFKLVYSSGTDPDGGRFDQLNDALRARKADIIDEHYYRRPEWFLENAKRYDAYPRDGSKIFAGEYAAQSDKVVSVENRNNWHTAIAEAAFMTGLERNADVVNLASYAPLFAHTDGWQWTPDLIWVDNLRSFGTPDYYVQKLFATNRGSKIVPITLQNEVIAGKDSLYASASLDENTRELIIKIVNVSANQRQQPLELEGVRKTDPSVQLTVMKGDLAAMNSLDDPKNVVPEVTSVSMRGNKLSLPLAPYSFSVLRIKMR